MKEVYRIHTNPAAPGASQVTGEGYRITVLTEGLIRLEHRNDQAFEDRPTQMVMNRDFPEVPYRVIRKEDGIEIHTSRLHLIYNEKEFSPHGLSIQVKGNVSNYGSIWHYGDPIKDLGGTARTLDEADGAVDLDHGVISRYGFSLLDDSDSLALLPDGWVEPRKKGGKDLYFFGYGHDYREALKDFYHLCGPAPMLPRYAFGNWWSRYYPYTEETYGQLMDRFEAEKVPFTVAVVDMDWHLVEIDEKYGSGWTGYTWNREYFPDPARFLEGLHDRGMHVTLNVHPASGVRAHEEMYVDMAKAMGVDYAREDPVNCDVADPEYIENYFTFLHHPREKEGVDFWWVDWQQGTGSRVEGLDPLWVLNHYHYLDNGRDGRRPMTFSRYAGPGSHRYPVGFSGDTIITWESLDFQPYFTATASNIGYGWWSHDIGGHMRGYKDDELAARWYQLGAYSPVTRLHSSNSPFNGKEPWRFKAEAREVMKEALRQRHRMIPYVYSMNYRNYEESLPLIQPMYYEYPEEDQAYQVKNQYYFGSQLIVAPVTTPRIRGLNMAPVKVWLPGGIWYDIYTGMIYDGDRSLTMYRGLESIPVLAKAGAILPFTEEISAREASKNPDSLTVFVYAGADGAFTLYEDDNESQDYKKGICAKTRMTYKESESQALFTIEPAGGDLSLIPAKRRITVELAGFGPEAAREIALRTDGKTLERQTTVISYKEKKQSLSFELEPLDTGKRLEIILPLKYRTRDNETGERVFDLLNQAEISFDQKDLIYRLVQKERRIPALLAELGGRGIGREVAEAVAEIVTAL